MWERADERVEPEVLDEDLEEAADEESVLVDERDEPEPADEEDEEAAEAAAGGGAQGGHASTKPQPPQAHMRWEKTTSCA